MNRRRKERPPANFDGPRDFADNALGSVAYIHLEGSDHVEETPLTGLLNEVNEAGCSIIVSDGALEQLKIGTPCFLRLEPDHRGRAVVRWIGPFGVNATKVGFQFDS